MTPSPISEAAALTGWQKRRPPLQPGGYDGGDVHGVVVVRVPLPPRHRHWPDADGLDKHLFRTVGRVGGADAGDAGTRPRHHRHRRYRAAGHVDVRRQGGVPANEQTGCPCGRGRGCGCGALGDLTGRSWRGMDMNRRHGDGPFATKAKPPYDFRPPSSGDRSGLSEGPRGTESVDGIQKKTIPWRHHDPCVHTPNVEVEV